MTKKALIKKIAVDAGITRQQASEVLDSFAVSVARTLKNGQSITLFGFGSFSLLQRIASRRRNPLTGALMRISARRTAKFNASPILSAKL